MTFGRQKTNVFSTAGQKKSDKRQRRACKEVFEENNVKWQLADSKRAHARIGMGEKVLLGSLM